MKSAVRRMLIRARTQVRVARHASRVRRAAVRRELLGSAPVIAVTGTAVKTTTVALLSHLLGGPPSVGVSLYANTMRDALGQFINLGPRTSAAVVEASEFPVGTLASIASVLRPTVAVFTISGLDHYASFRGAAAAAAEMATLARDVPAHGFLVVNADDADLCRSVSGVIAPVVTFGVAPEADYRAVSLAVGPDRRLTIDCRHGGEHVLLTTPFIGRHFHVAALAAVAVAHRLGVSWHDIRSRIATFEPVFGRCTLLSIPGGPLFICDTTKSPAWSMQSSIETLDAFADASRRTLVLGTLSDYAGDAGRAYRKALRHAWNRVDRIVFLRHTPSHVGASAEDVAHGRAVFLKTVKDIAAYLQKTAVPGEVILLKGSSGADHLDRIAHAFVSPVACWLDKCGRNMNCINCEWMRDHTPATLRPLKKLQHKVLGRRRIYG